MASSCPALGLCGRRLKTTPAALPGAGPFSRSTRPARCGPALRLRLPLGWAKSCGVVGRAVLRVLRAVLRVPAVLPSRCCGWLEELGGAAPSATRPATLATAHDRPASMSSPPPARAAREPLPRDAAQGAPRASAHRCEHSPHRHASISSGPPPTSLLAKRELHDAAGGRCGLRRAVFRGRWAVSAAWAATGPVGGVACGVLCSAAGVRIWATASMRVVAGLAQRG